MTTMQHLYVFLFRLLKDKNTIPYVKRSFLEVGKVLHVELSLTICTTQQTHTQINVF